MGEIVGYKFTYNQYYQQKDETGTCSTPVLYDVQSLHPSMFLSRKEIRKIKRRLFGWNLIHFYSRFFGKRKDWQKQKGGKTK